MNSIGIFTDTEFDIDFLQDEIRKISANLSKLGFYRDKRIDELRLELEAFECVVLQYYKMLTGKDVVHPSKMYALNDFEPCSLCWRFVPKKKAGDNTKTFCDVHQYDPGSKYSQTEYMRALKFPCNKPDSDMFIDRRLTKLLKTLHYVFRSKLALFYCKSGTMRCTAGCLHLFRINFLKWNMTWTIFGAFAHMSLDSSRNITGIHFRPNPSLKLWILRPPMKQNISGKSANCCTIF